MDDLILLQPIRNNLLYISIHIPKTAGTSFQQYLAMQFGNRGLQRLDFKVKQMENQIALQTKNNQTRQVLENLVAQGTLSEKVKVVHGHYTYQDINKLIQVPDETKWITWVRDPVKRVISNFNYLHRRFDEEVTHNERSKKIFNRLSKSIVEFASIPRQTKLYKNYLSGMPLQQFDFIGIMEDMEEEILALEKTMGWAHQKYPYVNQTKGTGLPIKEYQMKALRQLLSEEIELYEDLKRMRDQRMQKID